MVTSTILLLLVGAASTIAFTPPLYRIRRAADSGGKSSSSSSSFSSSSSGSGAGGFGSGGFGGNGGGGFGGSGAYPYYPNSNYNPNQGVPFDYETLFRQFYEHLQRLSQLHSAYTPNTYAASLSGSAGHGHFGWAANMAVPRHNHVHRVPHVRHQIAAPQRRGHLTAGPLTYSQSRAQVRVFPGRYGPGFGSNSIDYGTGGGNPGNFGNPGFGSGYGGGYGGGFGGPGFQQPNYGQPGGFGTPNAGGQQGFHGNQQGYGAPPGFGNQGAFATSSGGFGTPAHGGNQAGGYGGNVGGNQGGTPGGEMGLDTRGGFAFSGSSTDGSPVGAQASISLGNRGGFGQAEYFPPELGSRIGQDIPPPSGGNFAVFSSSSSGSSDVNGKKTSFKQATIGVNDNGKVSTYSVKNP